MNTGIGYGHRLTARYNANDNGTLDDDPVDVYSYDHLWRIRTVTQATHSSEGWTSFVREPWFYHTGDDPYGYKIGSDAPVMRRIDADGDGTFEATQNFVTDRQGSVVGVLGAAVPVDVNNEAAGMKPGEVIARVRYDTYGVPTICDPADIDRDGVVDIADVALYCAYWNAWHTNGPNTARYKEILDYNRDGIVDANDPCVQNSANVDFAMLSARAFAVMEETVPDVRDVVGNLPLYAGYWWDARLEMYHVRHRVYRPEWGKWIQRDPLGYAAGWNLYEYVGGEPWRNVDPMGLDRWSWYDGWGDTVRYLVGGGTAAETAMVREAYAEGIDDGLVMTYDVVTFGLDSEIHEEAERIYEAGDWTYAASRAFSMLGRTLLMTAAAGPIGRVFGGMGSFGQALGYGLGAWGVGGSVWQVGTGIGRVMEGDEGGWWDIYGGGLNLAPSVTLLRGVGSCGKNPAAKTVDKTWKFKIHGKAQKTGTPGHQFRTYREAINAAKDPDAISVHLNSGYNRALGLKPKTISPNRRPDVLTLYRNFSVRRVEVQSRTDIPAVLRSRNTGLDLQLIDLGFTPLPPVVIRPH